jgi:hypothetical protein
MKWLWTPKRRDDPELMDAPGLPEYEVAEAYRVLRRVNRQLGNLRSMGGEVRRMLAEENDQLRGAALSVLDVGSGSGDVPGALAEKFAHRLDVPRLCVLDQDATAV